MYPVSQHLIAHPDVDNRDFFFLQLWNHFGGSRYGKNTGSIKVGREHLCQQADQSGEKYFKPGILGKGKDSQRSTE